MLCSEFSVLCSCSLLLFPVLSSLKLNPYTDFISLTMFSMGFFFIYLFLFDICLFLFRNLLCTEIIPFISLRALNILVIVMWFTGCCILISPPVESSPDLACWLSCLILLSLQSSFHVKQLHGPGLLVMGGLSLFLFSNDIGWFTS